MMRCGRFIALLMHTPIWKTTGLTKHYALAGRRHRHQVSHDIATVGAGLDGALGERLSVDGKPQRRLATVPRFQYQDAGGAPLR